MACGSRNNMREWLPGIWNSIWLLVVRSKSMRGCSEAAVVCFNCKISVMHAKSLNLLGLGGRYDLLETAGGEQTRLALRALWKPFQVCLHNRSRQWRNLRPTREPCLLVKARCWDIFECLERRLTFGPQEWCQAWQILPVGNLVRRASREDWSSYQRVWTCTTSHVVESFAWSNFTLGSRIR